MVPRIMKIKMIEEFIHKNEVEYLQEDIIDSLYTTYFAKETVIRTTSAIYLRVTEDTGLNHLK